MMWEKKNYEKDKYKKKVYTEGIKEEDNFPILLMGFTYRLPERDSSKLRLRLPWESKTGLVPVREQNSMVG
jgi:hypothetical protein